MIKCGEYNGSKVVETQKGAHVFVPASFTPLRASAHFFAAEAGYVNAAVKIKENRAACMKGSPAWDVYVKPEGATRGKLIGTMLDRACEPFGPYSYD